MGFGFFTILESFILVLNAVAVLHEQRFLNKIGWGKNQNDNVNQGFGHDNQPSFKTNFVSLIHSIRTVTRLPLIFINIIVIIFKLIAG